MESRRSGLNLPAGMEASLHLSNIPTTYFPSMPKTPSPSKKTTYSDRFIPCRSSSRFQNFGLVDAVSPAKEGANEAYARLLRTELFGAGSSPGGGSPAGQGSPMSPSNNLFRFKTEHSAPSSPFAVDPAFGQDGGALGEVSTPPKVPRKVPKTPHKVLDAPSLQDDFYLNLVDWSSQNTLAVGLGTCVYLWNASTSKVTKLCDLGPRDGVCAVQWTREGSYLAVGTSLGDVQVWDITRCKKVRTLGGHQTRTGVLAWSSLILASGSRDKNILQHDLRVSNDYINMLVGHRSETSSIEDFMPYTQSGGSSTESGGISRWTQQQTPSKRRVWLQAESSLLGVKASQPMDGAKILPSSEINAAKNSHQEKGSLVASGVRFVESKGQVCGLKWSHDDRELASGGNDNQLLVWNQQSQKPVLKFTEHTAAVKAIAWSPHQHGLLASGGGTADRCIRFWNTTNNNMLKYVDTGSQVCNLLWCKNVNELVSTHGYSQNQIMVWKYPSMAKVATLTGHALRVLYLASSPDGQTIVTGAGDETLRFWNVFPSMKAPAPVRDSGIWSLGRTHIR